MGTLRYCIITLFFMLILRSLIENSFMIFGIDQCSAMAAVEVEIYGCAIEDNLICFV